MTLSMERKKENEMGEVKHHGFVFYLYKEKKKRTEAQMTKY